MDSLNHMDFINVVVTLWDIRTARHKAIHEAVFQSPQATHVYVEKFIRELQTVQQVKSTARATTGRPISHVVVSNTSSHVVMASGSLEASLLWVFAKS